MSEESATEETRRSPRDKDVMREKRARGIVAMGLVTRDGDIFRVTTPSLRNKATYEVKRDENQKVRCSCPEYALEIATNPKFRCEHVLAVKHALESGADLKPFTNFATAFQKPAANKEEEMSKNPQAGENTNRRDKSSVETAASVVPFTNTLQALRQQVDPNLVKTREGWTDRQGNTHMVEYLEWHTVADVLDRVAPAWSHAVRSVIQIGDIAVVTAAITIDGITREGVGTGTAESEMGIKKAEHDALKRAAVKFGIARDLYQRESDVIEQKGSSSRQGGFPRDPLAKSMADLVTPKQLGMIRALAREAGVDVEEECQSVLRCKTDELSKRAASSYIDHLKGLSQQSGSGGMRRAS
jgi:Rad52/22 family double-strand break repair protein/SWIM zinc finger